MCSTGRTCLAWIYSEMKLDLDDECREDCENVTWAFARNATFLVERHFNEKPTPFLFVGRIPHCAACSNNYRYFWKIYDFLMNCFEAFRLRDSEVAGLVLGWGFTSMRRYSAYRRMVLRSAMWFPEHMLGEADYRRLAAISYTSRDFRNCQAEVVWNAVKTGKEVYVASLLRFGVMYLTPRSGGILWDEFYEAFGYLFSWMKCRRSLKPLDRFERYSWPSRRMVNVLRVVQLLALKIDAQPQDYSDSDGPQRKKLRVDFEENCRFFGIDRFQCLKMLFDAIPEPFVTSQEIRGVLTMACEVPWSDESELLADELIAHFEQLYPDGKGSPAPRSLQHLSRCQARDNLRQSGALPHGFYDLVLPNSLRKYILLEE